MLFMTTRFPLDHPGGVERVARALMTRVLSDDPNWEITHVAAYQRRAGLARVPLLGDLAASVLLAVRVGRRADVVLVHGAEYAWAFLLAARLTGQPVVVVWHGVRGGESLPPVRGLLDRMAQGAFLWANGRLERLALTADATIVVAPGVADSVRRRHGVDLALHVVPNGVEKHIERGSLASSDDHTSEAEQPPQEGEPAILRAIWIGTSSYKKGLDIAIGACQEARRRGQGVTLTIVGVTAAQAGSRWNEPGGWVSWLGLRPPGEVDALLAHHDVLLFPPRYEAFGMVVLEAMAAGLPVVGSGAVGWIVGEAGETVTKGDCHAYADALGRLADPRVRMRLGAAARMRASTFSWDSSAADYSEVIREVAN
jgi:glycosyltransferase involved in cell wall biosynthesis